MRPTLPNAFDDLKTLSQICYVKDGKVMVIERKNQPKPSFNIPFGGHLEPQDLASPPARELREERGNVLRPLVTGKPYP
jgi:ADP-ribose pyrophosphatase YjhB (NUDIX family)